MGKLIKGIHHVALKCMEQEEFDRTISFYKNVLGLEVLRTWGEGKGAGVMFSTGSGVIEIFANGEAPLEQGAIRHVAFATDDVDECIRTVHDAGYEIILEPEDKVIGSKPPYPIRVGFCIGPVGEEIEFFQER